MRSLLIATCLACGLTTASQIAAISVTAASRSVQPGELVVLTIATAAAADIVRVRAFGRDLSPFVVGARQWRVLVGIDLDVTAGSHPVSIEAGTASHVDRSTYDLVVRPKRFPTRTLKVDEAFVNPPAGMSQRIAAEAQTLEQLWSAPSPVKLWSGPFVRPVPDPANSAFGTRSVFNGQPRSPHGGADFLSGAGTPVNAPNAGRVVLARELYFSGNTVIIDHGLGLLSMLAHLSAIDVREGDLVAMGQSIGKVGSTGRVTGPHLHWAVRANSTRVDPLSVLAVLGSSDR